jgi:hypothetical protein
LPRLLQGSPQVTALLTALLEQNPFPKVPPKYMQAMLYDYRFTSLREKAASGRWWARRLSGAYYRRRR